MNGSEKAMTDERRKHKAICRTVRIEMLNAHQLRALRDINRLDWQLLFVRTSLFQDPVVVIVDPRGEVYATLEHDGQVNMTPDLSLQESDWSILNSKAS